MSERGSCVGVERSFQTSRRLCPSRSGRAATCTWAFGTKGDPGRAMFTSLSFLPFMVQGQKGRSRATGTGADRTTDRRICTGGRTLKTVAIACVTEGRHVANDTVARACLTMASGRSGGASSLAKNRRQSPGTSGLATPMRWTSRTEGSGSMFSNEGDRPR